jgi:hypothetical protein
MRALSDNARYCAANNADLHQSIFRAHGLKDHRNQLFWWSEESAPPYYANLTTLDPEAVEMQFAGIERLRLALGRSFSIKDGFRRLDLVPLGFRPLFDACWIWLDPLHPAADGRAELPAQWTRITDDGELEEWESAWRAASPTDKRVFPSTILDDADVAIFGRTTGDRFDAGCIANRSAAVVGLSNIFATSGMTRELYEQAVAAAFSFVADRPLVGYEHGAMLQMAQSVGFEPAGPLRVWLLERTN